MAPMAAVAALILIGGVLGARRLLARPSFDVSPFGKKVLREGGRRWLHLETPHFFYHAPDTERMVLVQDVAEFAYEKVCEYLPGAEPVRKGHVFSVSADMWDRVLREADRRRDSLAMQAGHEVFVLEGGAPAETSVRLAHEIVHYRVWQLWGERLPVWLDEGLAGCVGWDIAESFRLRKGWQLSRDWPAAEEGPAVDLAQLTGFSAYPAPGPEAQLFYRQCEAFVRAIARRIGFAKLPGFVDAQAEGESWDACLRGRFAFTDFDFRWLAEETSRNLAKGGETK